MTSETKPTVLLSLESRTGERCVDLFRREDGSFGFEEYRKDPEDMGRWTRVGQNSDIRFPDLEAATVKARMTFGWLID